MGEQENPTTIAETRRRKRALEGEILKLVQAFEKDTGARAEEIELTRAETPDGRSIVFMVSLVVEV